MPTTRGPRLVALPRPPHRAPATAWLLMDDLPTFREALIKGAALFGIVVVGLIASIVRLG